MAIRARDNDYYLNVDSYYDKLHHTTWARRTAGMLAGATLGLMYGSIVGAIAAFVPYILGAIGVSGALAVGATLALPGPITIGSSMALFGIVTAGIGMAITTDVATNAASSAAGMEEKEKRERLEHLQEANPSVSNETPSTAAEGNKEPPFFSWKIAAVTVPLFAIFGTLAALHPFTAAAVFQKGAFPGMVEGAVTPASITASASVFGIFGMFLGLKNSFISNKLCDFYYKIVTSQPIGNAPEKEITVTPPAINVENVISHEPAREMTSFAERNPRFSLQKIIEKNDINSAAQKMLTR